jgi:hypothetical protein
MLGPNRQRVKQKEDKGGEDIGPRGGLGCWAGRVSWVRCGL